MQSAPNARDKIKVADVVVSTNHVTFLTNRFPRQISLPTSTVFVSGTSGITAILKYKSVNPIYLKEKQLYIFYQLDNGNDYTKDVHVCVYKTRILSVQLSVCICVCMSELKREDRLLLTYMCMCKYMRMSWYVWVFRPTLLTVVYISGSFGVNLSCRNVLVCWSVSFSPLWTKKTSLFILLGKIKVDQSKTF